ncbi:MAG: hypothetical protein PHD32_04065 [Eubacteriales bacterium]|nr:hypothetical protein [Eubacteriales bacterium]
MLCTCVRENDQLILRAADVLPQEEAELEAAFFTRAEGGFEKRCSACMPGAAQVMENFPRLGAEMFGGQHASWQAALEEFARRCAAAGVEWYITGSVCDALRGAAVTPHDVDLVVRTRSVPALADLFADAVVEPFSDLGDSWVVRWFGRVCLCGTMVDVVADESTNAGHHAYEPLFWRGYSLAVEPLALRYEVELQRGRAARVAALEALMDSKRPS